jgi:hypothetical protein
VKVFIDGLEIKFMFFFTIFELLTVSTRNTDVGRVDRLEETNKLSTGPTRQHE